MIDLKEKKKSTRKISTFFDQLNLENFSSSNGNQCKQNQRIEKINKQRTTYIVLHGNIYMYIRYMYCTILTK